MHYIIMDKFSGTLWDPGIVEDIGCSGTVYTVDDVHCTLYTVQFTLLHRRTVFTAQ